MLRLALFAALACFAPAQELSPAADTAAPPIVQTTAGLVRGVDQGATRAFLGVPFAAPPVGDLRWRAPQSVTPWEGVRAAESFGPMCPQPDMGRRRFDGPASEDCLYLNVFAPAGEAPEDGWPVLFWIHGGAFAVGSASSEIYDGSRLASKDVVVVTANYRLGVLGFLAHPQLTAEGGGTSGNYGLLDQIAALEWVRDNVAAFGGDPGRVTIFGESAGAVSVNHLMVMPAAEGLFHRAILESGHALMTRRALDVDGAEISGETQGRQLAERLGLAAAEDPLAALRSLPVDALVAQTGVVVGGGDAEANARKFWPLVDGVLVPDQPERLLRTGAVHPVDVIIGTNANEGSVMMRGLPVVTRQLYRELLTKAYGDGADEVEALFPVQGLGAKDVVTEVMGVASFVAPARRVARWLVEDGHAVYLYHFTRVPKVLERFGKLADHGAEIPYVFGHTQDGQLERVYGPRDDALSDEMMTLWATFARTGQPGEAWPAYSLEGDQHLEFGDRTEVGTHLYAEACDLFDRLAEPAD